MNKDIFEIAMRDQLRSAESDVPANAWEAIQNGLKAGGPTSAPQSGGNFGWGFGLAAGAAIIVAFATYSEVRDQGVNHEGDATQHVAQEKTNTQIHNSNTISLEDAKLEDESTLGEAPVDAKPVADIVVVQKAASTLVVNESPNSVRVQLEALEPLIRQDLEAIVSTSNQSDANHAHGTVPELKTKDISVENEVDAFVAELTEVDAIISASEIVGYAPMTVKFDNLGEGADHAWDFGQYGMKYEKSPEVTFEKPGVYNVYLSVANENDGDLVSDVIQVTVKEGSHLYYPNAITPNGDGINDRYKLDGYLIKSFLLIITNQKGDIVFQTRDINEPWACNEVVNDMGETKYFVTYKAIGVDGKVYAKDRMPLAIMF